MKSGYSCLTREQTLLIYTCEFPLFSKNNTLKYGKYRISLMNKSKTSVDRLEKMLRKYHLGDIPKIEWLDRLAFTEIDNIRKSELKITPSPFLNIQLQCCDFPLVYGGDKYSSLIEDVDMYDPEIFQENPVELQHRKLARSHRCDTVDRELKPNPKFRDELNDILRYPPTKVLSDLEKDLIWRFRYYLTREKKAMTKFLKCVVWSDPVEARQASEMYFYIISLLNWVEIDIEDSLELLSPAFTNSRVRSFAVMQLKKANDNVASFLLFRNLSCIFYS